MARTLAWRAAGAGRAIMCGRGAAARGAATCGAGAGRAIGAAGAGRPPPWPPPPPPPCPRPFPGSAAAAPMNAAMATMAMERLVRLGRARNIVATPEARPSDNAGDADLLRAKWRRRKVRRNRSPALVESFHESRRITVRASNTNARSISFSRENHQPAEWSILHRRARGFVGSCRARRFRQTPCPVSIRRIAKNAPRRCVSWRACRRSGDPSEAPPYTGASLANRSSGSTGPKCRMSPLHVFDQS